MPVRRVRPADREVLRAVRLRSLREDPDAFGSTYEREAAFPDRVWEERLGAPANVHFLWIDDDGRAAGLVAGVRDDAGAASAYVVGMWVAPDARGRGAADALVAAVARWAGAHGVTTLHLHVVAGNERAERLYARHGFAPTGRTNVRERDGTTELEMACAVASVLGGA